MARLYVGTEEFSLFQKFWTGTWVHPVLFAGFRNSVPESHLRPVLKLKTRGSIPPVPHSTFCPPQGRNLLPFFM